MTVKRTPLLSALAAAATLFFATDSPGQWNFPAEAPAAPTAQAQSLRLATGAELATIIDLGPADATAIDAVKRANAEPGLKALQIGIGRPVPSSPSVNASGLRWQAMDEGLVAQWRVTSAGARALRVAFNLVGLPPGVELRLSEHAGMGTVHGPFTVADLPAGERLWWSPVLQGETAIVEVFAPRGQVPGANLAVAQVSHLFASPADARIDAFAKIGESGSCEVDIICRSATDAALASVGKSVARMVFTVSGGGSALCTGTLLNPADGSFTPYFYSAAHCFSTQSEASTLATFWFYDATACRSGVLNPGTVQRTGGATLLFANTTTDVLFLRLNTSPPSGAVYAGWEAATLTVGTALTAVHHPAGDVKKVSLGDFAGFTAYGGGTGSNHLDVTWRSTATGVTEGGSSGSGVFSLTSGNYLLRGGLHGGPSSCSATGSSLRDYYSRFDQAYPSISAYLSPSVSCTYAIAPTSASIGASGGGGSFSVTTTAGCSWTASSAAAWLTTSSSGTGSGTVAYSAASNTGTVRSGTITVGGQTFTLSQAAATGGGSGSSDLIVNGDFESGATGWVESSPYPILTTDATFARGGTRFAFLGGYSNASDVLYQDVAIPSDATSATFRFWYRIQTSEAGTTPWDTMTVTVRNPSSGAVLATVLSLSNANASASWAQSPAFDMTAFKGQTVRLHFAAATDGSLDTNFFVDDVTLAANGGGSYSLSVVTTGAGTVTSSPAGINCPSSCIAAFASGTGVMLSATPGPGYDFAGWSGACTGLGACAVTMDSAKIVTANFVAGGTESRLVNISTRGQVLTGNDVMIGGFVVGGTAPKKVLVTARGPSLTSYGVAGAMLNPVLQVFSGQAQIAANDNWQDNAPLALAEIKASGLAPSDPLEAALMLTLNPGAYTAIVTGASGGTGVGIIEVFEQGSPEVPLVNISTRGQVQTGSSVMIGGFIIQGSQPKTVLITARGPSLAQYGITNALADPNLKLYSGQALIAENEDVSTSPNLTQIQATGVAPSHPLESAILITLNPGAYTAVVSGYGGKTGVGIVEVFAR